MFVDVQVGHTATVRGETNLPDGTELTIETKEPGDWGRSFGEDSPKVAGGRFRSVELGPDGGFLEGDYVVSALVPIADVQPPQVQAVMGANGERLKGPLVHRAAIGITIETESPFIVGDPKTAPAAGKARRQQTRAFIQSVLTEWRALLQRARSADRSEEAWGSGSCMARARKEWDGLEPRTKALEGYALTLPGVSRLRAAGISLHGCASCANDYTRDCDAAKEDLDIAGSDVAKASFK